MIFTDKKNIRKEIKQLLAEYKESFISDSFIITKQIIESVEYKNADTVLSYMSLPDEVDVNINILSENKKVFIPKVREENLSLDFFRYTKTSIKTGTYNITEPDETSEIFNVNSTSIYGNILVLIPGRAFTADGKRLGRGKGFYDRFLQKLKSNTIPENLTLAGVCFPFQIIENLPIDKYDIKMNIVYTIK